jgi:hypothetical protein
MPQKLAACTPRCTPRIDGQVSRRYTSARTRQSWPCRDAPGLIRLISLQHQEPPRHGSGSRRRRDFLTPVAGRSIPTLGVAKKALVRQPCKRLAADLVLAARTDGLLRAEPLPTLWAWGISAPIGRLCGSKDRDCRDKPQDPAVCGSAYFFIGQRLDRVEFHRPCFRLAPRSLNSSFGK